jgi:hypothetical protein
MQVGDLVIYHDTKGQPHNALVTAVHGAGPNPCINLAYVSGDESRTDNWGRQIERQGSVVHKSSQTAHGQYWRRLGEKGKRPVTVVEV